ncbi:hypothetical protein SprV_0702344200 [Sparganum proliferum]
MSICPSEYSGFNLRQVDTQEQLDALVIGLGDNNCFGLNLDYSQPYEQVRGTPIGSPISGFIAEAVLQRLESLVFQHHKPKFWVRYVDDTFVVIDRDQLLTFKERLKAVFPDIQFMMEEEENNQLAFLDVLVGRKDCGGLKTKVFRKATNTMQVLNFNSNHPISHKRSCVRTLYRRVETCCSEPEDKIAELQ